MEAIACGKVNLALQLGSAGPGGLHPLQGIFQSVAWADHLVLEPAGAGESGIGGAGGAPVPDDDRNLAWLAANAVRTAATEGDGGSIPAWRLILDKRIPVAAGLGGGSADAAAALALAAALAPLPLDQAAALAPDLGSDVPFCFRGGTAVVSGTGDRVRDLDVPGPYALGVVVPPIELATGDVYAAWDRAGEPTGPSVAGRDLPPGLRDLGPLRNDLFPAAVSLAPTVAEWHARLEEAWGRPVLLSGSGPSLFGFFVDTGEAEAAVDAAPPGARARRAVVPAPFGWAVKSDPGDVPVDSRGERLAGPAGDWWAVALGDEPAG